jgi:glycosyltransferase involved in cell wall biosynthesis
VRARAMGVPPGFAAKSRWPEPLVPVGTLSPNDLIHALAQLPDEVSLELSAEGEQRARLERLSSAYALEQRITMSETAPTSWKLQGSPSGVPVREGTADASAGAPGTIAEAVEDLWPPNGPIGSASRADPDLSEERVAIVTNHPAHYRIPLFNGLSARVSRAGGSLRVLFLGTEARREWLVPTEALDFEHEFVSSMRLPTRVSLSSELDRRRPSYVPRALRRRLRAFDPTLVAAGGFSLSSVESCLYCMKRRIPFGIWSGEVPGTATQRSHTGLRAVQRRWLAGRSSFGIAYGSLAERYLHSLAPELPVVIGRNSSVTGVRRREIRPRSDLLEVLAVADVTVPGKGIETVVEALRLAPELRCRFTLIGGVPEEGALLDAPARDPRVRFLGPLPHNEVMAAYERSDVFVFPSTVDIFGHAAVEAMSSELAVVLSDRAAPLADIALHGHNCLVARADDPPSWARCLEILAGDEEHRRSLAQRARESIERRWTIDHAVEAMMSGVRLGLLTAAGRSR